MITIGTARDLARLNPPVGIFFESECIFSLNDDSQMALTFQATMAEEESHTRSRSMETSLRMRLDNGIPLTPKLLGYTHDLDGNLVINPDEAPTVKLAFYMYLYGFSTKQIAEAFNALERKSYYGNTNWTSSGIVQILRNERHCGDVLTRKTYTEDYRTHRQLKNRGNKPQSRYYNHHEAIIGRDDFIAVQHLLDNAKYHNKSILPELRVIDTGIFKGFVSINPRWAGFREEDYYQASQSAYLDNIDPGSSHTDNPESIIEFSAGDFDLRGFQVTRDEFFDAKNRPYLIACLDTLRFGAACARKFGPQNTIELLINPFKQELAIRPTKKDNRNAVIFSTKREFVYTPKQVSMAAFSDTLFALMGWKKTYRYRILGELLEQDGQLAYVFKGCNAVAYLSSRTFSDPVRDGDAFQPLTRRGHMVRAIPAQWTASFGKPFYEHDQTIKDLARQTETDWKIRIQGTLYTGENRLNVTGFDELREYIQAALSGTSYLEASDDESREKE